MIYANLIRPFLFRKDAEDAHELTLRLMGRVAQLRFLHARSPYSSPLLKTTVSGIQFPNPVGLAAGCDKNAIAVPIWPRIGFGFVEIGTVTAQPQPGNDKPRVFRYRDLNAVVNRLGFNGEGSDVVAARLQKLRALPYPLVTPLAVNIGKTKVVTDEAKVLEDYRTSFKRLTPYGDFVVINVSSPNTPGLRQWQEKGPLKSLLGAIMDQAATTHCFSGKPAPVYVKMSPDMADQDMFALIEVAWQQGLSGIIATNTTIARPGATAEIAESGGLSGQPLKARANEVMKFLYRESGGKLPLIGVGGIASAADAYQRIRSGASLVQLYTGMVYEGPLLARKINRELQSLLTKDGYTNVADAVGADT